MSLLHDLASLGLYISVVFQTNYRSETKMNYISVQSNERLYRGFKGEGLKNLPAITNILKAREEGCTLRAIQLLGKVKEGSKKRSFVGKLQLVVYPLVYSFLIKESWW